MGARPGGCAAARCAARRERAEARAPASGPGALGGSLVPPGRRGRGSARAGTKTLKKLFIDERCPAGERERIPVLADGRAWPRWRASDLNRAGTAAPGQAAYELIFWKKE